MVRRFFVLFLFGNGGSDNSRKLVWPRISSSLIRRTVFAAKMLDLRIDRIRIFLRNFRRFGDKDLLLVVVFVRLLACRLVFRVGFLRSFESVL